MKKIYLLVVALIALEGANFAQDADLRHKSSCDTILLSEWIDGDYLVRRYKIDGSNDEAQYTLKYSASASKMNSLLAGNASSLADLDKMVAEMKGDENMHVTSIDITGYASPDGNPMSNEALALSRAQQFRSMLESRYGLASTYIIRVMSDAEQWDDCNEAVLNSTIANKDKVLGIIDSSASESAKEQQLKQMPQVWNVFRSQILPLMRRVEMVVNYNMDRVVEVRTLVEKPKRSPKPQQQRVACPYQGVVIDETVGIIIDLSDPNAIY